MDSDVPSIFITIRFYPTGTIIQLPIAYDVMKDTMEFATQAKYGMILIERNLAKFFVLK